MKMVYLLVNLALADVAPPPLSCPKGSFSASRSQAQWCSAMDCQSDADCTQKGPKIRNTWSSPRLNLKCETTPLCIEEVTRISLQRFINGMVENKHRVEHVHGPCNEQGGCNKGSCSTRKRCFSILPSKPNEKASTPENKQEQNETQQNEKIQSPFHNPESGCTSVAQPMYTNWYIVLMAVFCRRSVHYRC